jgi:polar amino acid transport system permease protein
MEFQFQFGAVFARSDLLLEGLQQTLQLAGTAIVFGGLLGTLLAGIRSLAPRAVGVLIDIYVELIRNTPFLVQLLITISACPPSA